MALDYLTWSAADVENAAVLDNVRGIPDPRESAWNAATRNKRHARFSTASNGRGALKRQRADVGREPHVGNRLRRDFNGFWFCRVEACGR